MLAGLDKSGTTHTNAGTYNGDPWAFTDVTGNYNDTSGTVNDKINQAIADCSSISGYTVTFDGNAHTATGSCKDLGGNELPGLDLSGTTHTNAGTYNADPWSFAGTTNYAPKNGTVNDKINKAGADCSSISGYTVTFDGNAHTASGSCKGVDGIALAGLDKSGTTHTNAGTYNADPWAFTDVTGNYNDTSGTVNDKIDKASADCCSISGYTVTYDGNAHTATGSCKDLGGNEPARARPQRHHPHRTPAPTAPTRGASPAPPTTRPRTAPSTTRSTRRRRLHHGHRRTTSPTTGTSTPPPARRRASRART